MRNIFVLSQYIRVQFLFYSQFGVMSLSQVTLDTCGCTSPVASLSESGFLSALMFFLNAELSLDVLCIASVLSPISDLDDKKPEDDSSPCAPFALSYVGEDIYRLEGPTVPMSPVNPEVLERERFWDDDSSIL